MMLNLKHLNTLELVVYGGSLPAQFGALDKLQSLIIWSYCLKGSLPSQWINGMRSLGQLVVSPLEAAIDYADPDGGTCGVAGTMPTSWFKDLLNTPSITYTDLSYNYLQGKSNWQLSAIYTIHVSSPRQISTLSSWDRISGL